MIASVFDNYRPDAAWYQHNPYGIHGLAHAARVLVWADQVAQSLMEQGLAVDVEVVRWAAALHDVGRTNDGIDSQHGQRSAEWAVAHRDQFSRELNDSQIEKLAYTCMWHVPRDARAPAMTPELVCLKDADGLDRVRIHDLDPRQLRTGRARALPKSAQRLYEMTRHQPGDPWVNVRDSATGLSLWR